MTGLFRSTDGGASFIKISGSGGLPTGSVTSLAFDPSNYNCVYAASQTPQVNEKALEGEKLFDKTAAGTIQAVISITEREFGYAAARAPKLGDGVGIVVLRSEI